MSLGPWEIILIAGIALLFFGPSRLPGLGKSVGEAIRSFKKGLDDVHINDKPPAAPPARPEEIVASESDYVESKEIEKDKTQS